jgi:hypothetical protein
MATHSDPPDEAYMHWEAPYADAEDPGATPPPFRQAPPGMRGPRLDFRPLFMLLEALRRGLPRELEEQFTTLLREILLTLRALIDWYIDRLEHPAREPQVEDIPID